MKRLLLLGLVIAMAACGEAAKVESKVEARDAAMDSATAKMVVTRGNNVAGHAQLVSLGKVHGHCMADPEANDIVTTGDNLRQAAYRKYGSQVDAIVDANAYHVNDDFSPEAASQGNVGHFECDGTAVHFADAK
jgi:hypothetical protein